MKVTQFLTALFIIISHSIFSQEPVDDNMLR